MSKPRIDTRTARVGGTDYEVHVKVWPARAAAHVSADSPRFLDPGTPRREAIVCIFRGREDVTCSLFPWARKAIAGQVLSGGAGVTSVSPALPSFEQLPLPLADGHLRRAMERTAE